MSSLGERVKMVREGLKISQNALEERAALNGGDVSRIESGKKRRVNPDALTRLAKALGVSIEFLTTGVERVARASQRPKVMLEEDVYPNRAKAIARARAAQVDERAIRRVLAQRLRDGALDRSEAAWFRILATVAEELEEELEGPASSVGRLPAVARDGPRRA